MQWEVGRGSVFEVPSPEGVGHRYDSKECEVGQEKKRLLPREGVAAPGQNVDGEGSEGKAGGRGVRTARGSWSSGSRCQAAGQL